MKIDDLKRALVFVRDLCAEHQCESCPLHKMDEVGVPYCPMHEDDDGITIHQPAFWVVGDWEDDDNEGD